MDVKISRDGFIAVKSIPDVRMERKLNRATLYSVFLRPAV